MFLAMTGVTSLIKMVRSLASILQDNGFSIVYQNDAPETFLYILQAEKEVDPYRNYSFSVPYRIAFLVRKNKLHLYVTNDLYLQNDGEIFSEPFLLPHDNNIKDPDVVNNPGLIYNFIDRSYLSESNEHVITMSCYISISDHGIFLGFEDENSNEYPNFGSTLGSKMFSPRFSWVLVQRPVDNNGDVYVQGKAPLVCLFTRMEDRPEGLDVDEKPLEIFTNPSPQIQVPYFFIVSESDVKRPTQQYRADVDEVRNKAILNAQPQVSIDYQENWQVTIPFGFNTSRYFYPLHLDMIGTCDAGPISHRTALKFKKFKNKDSTYLALQSNLVQGNGMRILVLIDGPSATDNLPSL